MAPDVGPVGEHDRRSSLISAAKDAIVDRGERLVNHRKPTIARLLGLVSMLDRFDGEGRQAMCAAGANRSRSSVMTCRSEVLRVAACPTAAQAQSRPCGLRKQGTHRGDDR
jgi:hypothetical protein